MHRILGSGRLALASLLLLGAAAAGRAQGSGDDEKTLREAGAGTDNAALLEFFRSRTVGDDKVKKIETLVAQLGDDSFEVREKASAQLLTFGAAAVPPLKKALTSGDVEVVKRLAIEG